MNPNLQRAILLYQQSRHEMAEDELRQALAAEPHDAYAHALLGLCLADREQFKEATEEAQQAVHLAPDFPFAHYTLAHIWHDRNHDPEALASINEALRLDSSDPDFFALLANIHLAEARWGAALEAAEHGLQLDAEHVTCNNLRAIALVKLGRKSEAGATIDAALRRNPENAVSHANQGWTLLEQHDPKRALEHFREALRLDPQNDWARRGIVEALKARHFVYALMLRYFLFMAKFSRRGQWGIVLAAYFGYQILRAMEASNPAWRPWVLPLIALYAVFVLMTWIASPLFNLLLRLNHFGRLVLTEDQIVASNWIGLTILLALLSLAGCLIDGFNSPWLLAALVFGVMLIPIAGTFRCARGSRRWFMAAYSAIIATIGLSGVFLIWKSNSAPDPQYSNDTAHTLFFISLIGAMASTWIVNLILSQRQRR